MSRSINATIDALWRMEAPKIIGALARMVRDVGLAEELAQDALIAALEQWPRDGVPEKPAAWLMKTAKFRAIDKFRRDRMIRDKNQEVARDLDAREDVSTAMLEAHLDDDIGDERLALIFAACHPELAQDAQAALTLRLIGGLSTGEIARAFLTTEPTIAQHITRAKKKLSESNLSFEVPHGLARNSRLAAVLQVIYLIFNEGYSASAGDDALRPQLCHDALRLGRILSELAPNEPEALGLLALMEIQASRFASRVAPDGSPILLLDQDRGRWDRLLIRRGLNAIKKAEALKQPHGPYLLQAKIAAVHARAPMGDQTDWLAIVVLYDQLLQSTPSPIIQLNRAVAIGMAAGPAAGLAKVETLTDEPQLQNYHLFYAVRADFLAKLNRLVEAAVEFDHAAELAPNAADQKHLRTRAAQCRAQV